jgi:transcriptional regulator with XRE-family HTH domain
MELGKRIKQARLDAGLSQRQLCGERLTRNMLSLIENGSARPSMDTLQFLAGQLNKPISFFLEEQAVTSPNQAAMAEARRSWRQKDAAGVLNALSGYQFPDETFDEEYGLLSFLACVQLAEQAIAQERLPYARQLLEQALGSPSCYITPAQQLKHQLLLTQTGQTVPLEIDAFLLVKAEAALTTDPGRCLALLAACDDQTTAPWQLLCGLAQYAQNNYGAALPCLTAAEDAFPARCIPALEICHRELGDYKKAYEYACKGRK